MRYAIRCVTFWWGATTVLSWSIGESHAETRSRFALAPGRNDDPTLFYIPPNHLMEIYISRSEPDHTPFSENPDDIVDPAYDWRGGMNYHLGSGVALHADARHRKLEANMPFVDTGDSKLGLVAKPWELRLGFSYRWGGKPK